MKTDAQLERDATSLGHDHSFVVRALSCIAVAAKSASNNACCLEVLRDLADDITALGKVNLSADDANDATKREQVKTYINRLLEKQLT